MEEAKDLITEPLMVQGIHIEDGVMNAILRLTGPHPCFISQLCNDLIYHIAGKDNITKEDVSILRGPFQASVFDDFSYYWQRLSKEEQSMLRDISEGNQPSSFENPIFLSLERVSLVRLEKGKAVPFSISFSQFLKDTKGTDIYFKQAFSDTTMNSVNFFHLAETMLGAANHIPDQMCSHLQDAIQQIQSRPFDSMYICGRMVLDPLV